MHASPGPEPHVGSEPHTHVRARSGESAPFHFTSQWQIEHPAVQVWEVFEDVARWPEWWPGVREVTVLDSGEAGTSGGAGTSGVATASGSDAGSRSGAANGEGTRAVLRVRRPVLPDLRVHLAVTQTDSPHRALVEVSGDLRGHGHWRAVDWCAVDHDGDGGSAGGSAASLSEGNVNCRVEFVWCVVTRSSLTKILRGVAGWAHRRVMDAGEEGLREQLDPADR